MASASLGRAILFCMLLEEPKWMASVFKWQGIVHMAHATFSISPHLYLFFFGLKVELS
jgi:hypothetical protein